MSRFSDDERHQRIEMWRNMPIGGEVGYPSTPTVRRMRRELVAEIDRLRAQQTAILRIINPEEADQ